METLTMLILNKMNGDFRDMIGVINACRTINDAINYQMDKHMVLNIVNDKNGVINRYQEWVVREMQQSVRKTKELIFYQGIISSEVLRFKILCMGKMIERLIVSQYIKKNYTCETNFLFEIKTEIVHQHYHKRKRNEFV